MAAVAQSLPTRRPQLVDALLDSIEERRRQLYLLRAAGVRAAGMRDLKDELRRLQAELAAAVAVRPATRRAS